MENKSNYTGRKIAIFTDAHSLLEPVVAVLEDARSKGITEIYSLGDDVGYGPNPREVMDTMEAYGVVSLSGNAEEYSILGLEPFSSYMTGERVAEQVWVESKLTDEHIDHLRLYPRSMDLLVGGKKIALCHFANDVRIYFSDHSNWSFQRAMQAGQNPTEQFYDTNAPREIQMIDRRAEIPGAQYDGYRSVQREPLFGGKSVADYDEVIQGHVHFGYVHSNKGTTFRTLRAVGMGYGPNEPKDMAYYIVLHERTDGYDVEEVYVLYDRKAMIEHIINSDMPTKAKIQKFVGM